MKNKVAQSIIITLFIIGFAFLLFPIVSNIVETQKMKNILSTYETNVKYVDNNNKDNLLKEAQEYNKKLYSLNLPFDNINININKEDYLNILNLGNGIMGKIEIPIIDVNLPIYHTSDDEVLSKGAGHLEGSSLPVGEKNTHSVITAHRGLANAKLFTRLDEVKTGDLFYITVLDKQLAYKVNDIQTIDPNNTSLFNIQKDKDLVSLMTCTPYGINTHRLIVTGERVPYEKQVKEEIHKKPLGIREMIFTTLPLILITVVLIIFIRSRKSKKYEKIN